MSLAPEDFDGWDMARRNISYAPPLRRPQDTTPFPKKLVSGQKLVKFDCFGSQLRTFDVDEAVGFAVSGSDHVWHWANGKLLGTDRVELTCPEVQSPVAVRYAWANNPVCNLTSMEGLPVTPFRTDMPKP